MHPAYLEHQLRISQLKSEIQALEDVVEHYRDINAKLLAACEAADQYLDLQCVGYNHVKELLRAGLAETSER